MLLTALGVMTGICTNILLAVESEKYRNRNSVRRTTAHIIAQFISCLILSVTAGTFLVWLFGQH